MKEKNLKKKSFFTSVIDFINKLVPALEPKEGKSPSRFSLYVRQVDKKNESYEVVRKTAELCDEAILIAKQRIQVIKRIQTLEEKMVELECYEKLTPQELESLKDLIDRFVSLNKDRNALRFQITGFDKGLVEMESLEDEAKYILNNMEESERNRKVLRQDINLLQGEKADLEHEYYQMQNAGDFIQKLSIGLLILFGIITCALGYMIFVNEQYMFMPVAVLCATMIILVGFIYFFRQKIRYELKLNLLKQQKCVELINKKNVVYAYHLNFLKFVYKKYNVRSSDKLKKNLRDFNDYKAITHRYDSIRNAMYQTEYQIENFLKEKNISNAMITIEKFAKTVDIDDKRKTYNTYATEKGRMEKRLEGLDKLHDGIWGELTLLSELDKTEEKLVEQILTQYAEEVENIVKINMNSAVGEEDEDDDEAKDMEDIMNMDTWYSQQG
ncbi:hypothetical protein LJB89_04130 [Tyzzerella sp. OttesenSCG-928-J15]|nr:hypothetical protein [Tyzzerella sp. OttesenSCG-928-J15]